MNTISPQISGQRFINPAHDNTYRPLHSGPVFLFLPNVYSTAMLCTHVYSVHTVSVHIAGTSLDFMYMHTATSKTVINRRFITF